MYPSVSSVVFTLPMIGCWSLYMVHPFSLLAHRRVAHLGALAVCAGFAAPSQAGGFFEDSSARLEARTVYFNRDFRDGSSSNPQGAS